MLFILFFEKKILKFISPLEFFHFIILSKQLLTTEKTKSSLEEVKVFIFLLIDYELQYMEMQLPSYLLIYLIFIWAFSNVKLLCPFLIWPFTNSFLRGRSTNLHGYRYHSPWFRKWKQRERWKRGRAGGALWEEEEGGTLGLRTPRWGPMGELVIRRGHGEMWNRHRVWCIYWGIEAISGASGSHSRETEQPCSTKRATRV